MADFKLDGPSRKTKRTRNGKKQGRKRAQTDVSQRAKQIDTSPEAKQEQDDFLDFLGIQQPSNQNANGNQNQDGAAFDAFGDFGGFGSSDSASTPPTKPTVSKDDHHVKSTKKRKKKMTQKPPLKKAKTVANAHSPGSYSSFEQKSNGSSPISNGSPKSPNSPKEKSAVKMKKIDVLPLLHRGIRANKFKLNGSKSKVRTFYLTTNNFYFCWEVVGQAAEKKGGGIFGGKNKGQNTRSKIDKERSSMSILSLSLSVPVDAVHVFVHFANMRLITHSLSFRVYISHCVLIVYIPLSPHSLDSFPPKEPSVHDAILRVHPRSIKGVYADHFVFDEWTG